MSPNSLDLHQAIIKVRKANKEVWAVDLLKDRYRLIIFNPDKAQKNAEHRNLQKEKESDELNKLLEEMIKSLEEEVCNLRKEKESDEKNKSLEENIVFLEERAENADQRTTDAEQRAADSNQVSEELQRQLMGLQQRALDAEQKASDFEQKASDA